MIAVTTQRFLSTDSSITEQLGEQIARNLHGGETIELISDLGAGKTTFVRGLASGLDSRDHVASPTFTINHEYRGSKLTLQHFDFYRLKNPGLVKYELAEFIGGNSQVVVVEWPESIKKLLPKKRLTIEFKLTDKYRWLIFKYPKSLSYLMTGLKNADTNN